jgi:hypothetical protein
VPDAPSNPDPAPRRSTLVPAALLLAALALVVLYTTRGEFLSPLALVVVAAIGFAALLLQLRMRPGLSASNRGPLWLNLLGVFFALGAVSADLLHASSALMLIAALGAVMSFAISGIIVLSAMRKRRV